MDRFAVVLEAQMEEPSKSYRGLRHLLKDESGQATAELAATVVANAFVLIVGCKAASMALMAAMGQFTWGPDGIFSVLSSPTG